MVEGLGFIQFHGFTPCIDFFKGTKFNLNTPDNAENAANHKELNVLLSECGDLRHILKTLCDALPLSNLAGGKRANRLNIWIHEKNLENLGRALLFLTLFCETGMSKRERLEIYLDLYANALIRDKSDAYMQGVLSELIQLVCDDDRCPSVIKPIVHLDSLRFKERDGLEDVISSYYNVHPFDMEVHRDNRLRGHFKDRYDVRNNLIDWDHNMYLREHAPHLHIREYKEWRRTGLAFETRLAPNTIPNRTMSSFVPGKNVSKRNNILEKNQRQHSCSRVLG